MEADLALSDFIEDLADCLNGGNSLGHESLVRATCREYVQPLLTWDEALDLVREHGHCLAECETCGWVSEEAAYGYCCKDEEE